MMFYCFFKHRRKGRTPRLYWPCQYIQGSGPLKEHKQIIKKPSKNQRNFGNDFPKFLYDLWKGFGGVWLWFGLQNTSKNHCKKYEKHPPFTPFYGMGFVQINFRSELAKICTTFFEKIQWF